MQRKSPVVKKGESGPPCSAVGRMCLACTSHEPKKGSRPSPRSLHSLPHLIQPKKQLRLNLKLGRNRVLPETHKAMSLLVRIGAASGNRRCAPPHPGPMHYEYFTTPYKVAQYEHCRGFSCRMSAPKSARVRTRSIQIPSREPFGKPGSIARAKTCLHQQPISTIEK